MNKFVTVHHPFALGADNLFAVQAGVPLTEALEAMALLLSTAETTAHEAAIAAGSDQNCIGSNWAIQHLLEMAGALNSSIHSGLIAAQRDDSASVQPGRA